MDTRLSGPPERSAPADLLLVDGRVTTTPRSGEESSSLLLRAGRVHAVGDTDELRTLAAPDVEVVDLDGRRAIPGLIDSHLHFTRAGLTWERQVDWTGVRSLEDGLAAIRDAAAARPTGEWIAVYGGWHPGRFAEGVGPTSQQLTEAAPEHPVYVQLLYEQGTLNEAGLRALGLAAASDAPAGGEVLVDDRGTPTGVVRGGGAFAHVARVIGRPDEEAQVAGVTALAGRLHGLGLTGVIDPGGLGVTPEMYRPLFEAWRRNALDLRVRLYLMPQTPGNELAEIQEYVRLLHRGFGDDWLRIVGFGEIVHYAFGDLEGLTPWSISAQHRSELREIVELCARSGWPVHMHAVLRDTITAALDVWEEVDATVPLRGRGFSLAHVEAISEADLRRVQRLGVGLAVQDRLVFRAHDSARVWGEDIVHGAPPLGRMLELGIPVGAGTDATVVTSYDPWLSMWWLVTGRSVDGAPPRNVEHRLSRQDALHLYTKGSAWFCHEDGVRGSLTPGDLGDVAVLSEDLFEVPEDDIRDLRSVLTIVGGKVVHDELS